MPRASAKTPGTCVTGKDTAAVVTEVAVVDMEGVREAGELIWVASSKMTFDSSLVVSSPPYDYGPPRGYYDRRDDRRDDRDSYRRRSRSRSRSPRRERSRSRDRSRR
jgi:hypothetical protein